MRKLLLLALLCLASCKSSPPPPTDPGGVHVRAPFVNVDVPPAR